MSARREIHTRIHQPKRFISKAWQYRRLWQRQLERKFQMDTAAGVDDDLPPPPPELCLPATRAGLNAMRWSLRKRRVMVKRMAAEKFFRRIMEPLHKRL